MTWVTGPLAYHDRQRKTEWQPPWWWPTAARPQPPSRPKAQPPPVACIECGAAPDLTPTGRPRRRCPAHESARLALRKRADRSRRAQRIMTDPEWLEKERERSRNYYERNREAILERHRSTWYPANRQSRKAQAASYIAKAQAASLPGARMRGLPWSATEDLLIRRAEVTALELALALGRTYKEVVHRKDQLGLEERIRIHREGSVHG